jgi:hypothetical protein
MGEKVSKDACSGEDLMNKIALSMISRGKGEEEKLRRALSTIAPHVDAVYITFTSPTNLCIEAEKVAKEFKANVSYNQALWTVDAKAVKWLTKFFGYAPEMKVGDKLFLFDDARNYNLSQIPKDYEWFLWMDTDDVFVGGEHLHRLAEMAKAQNVEALYFNYLYQAEFEKGEIKHRIIDHLRERLVRNNDHFKWVAPIHETLIETVPTKKTDVKDCEVVHLATDQDRQQSLLRNIKNLELAVYKSKGKDPRQCGYLAKVYFDLNKEERNPQAVHLILRYLNGDEKGEHKSGWPEERQQMWQYLAELYRRMGQVNNSTKSVLNAFTEPAIPQPELFLALALTNCAKEQWDLALFWTKIATSIPKQKTTLVTNELDLQAKTLQIIYNACLNTAKVDEAWAAGKKMLELTPNEPGVQNAFKLITEIREKRDMTKNIAELAEYLDRHGEGHKLKPLLQAAPVITEDTPFIQEIAHKINPPRIWKADEIMIYCGAGFTNWSPKQLNDPGASFVGGSEEAVIRMSQELQKLGWKVTVYGDPGVDEGDHDGVQWLSYYKFNKQDQFNIVISWRQIGFFDLDIKAKKKYLWNHDIQNAVEYNEQRVEKIDKVFFLSKWHRENVPSLPDEKVFITSNGI